jgi:hypothetical protein
MTSDFVLGLIVGGVFGAALGVLLMGALCAATEHRMPSTPAPHPTPHVETHADVPELEPRTVQVINARRIALRANTDPFARN